MGLMNNDLNVKVARWCVLRAAVAGKQGWSCMRRGRLCGTKVAQIAMTLIRLRSLNVSVAAQFGMD